MEGLAKKGKLKSTSTNNDSQSNRNNSKQQQHGNNNHSNNNNNNNTNTNGKSKHHKRATNTNESEPSKKKTRVENDDGENGIQDYFKLKVAPPTSEEIMQIKETETLFKTSLFRLQISELLKEVTVNYTKTTAIESALHDLKGILDSMPNKKPSGEFFRSFFIRNSSLVKPQFEKPADVSVIGSYLLHTVTKPILNIDVAVEIPKSFFSQDDIKDYVYHDKRHIYLAFLAARISTHDRFKRNSDDPSSGVFVATFSESGPDKLVLIIHPNPEPESLLRTNFCIRVIPTISIDTFDIKSLSPSSCNITSEDNSITCTPYYNNTIVEDMMMKEHLKYVHVEVTDNPTLVEVIQLFKVWLRKRTSQKHQYQHPHYPSGFHLTMLLAHLNNIKKLNRFMTSFQMMRITFHWICSNNLLANGILMKSKDVTQIGFDKKTSAEDLLQSFQLHFPVVFLDARGVVNVWSRVSAEGYRMLQNDAETSLHLLNETPIRAAEKLTINDEKDEKKKKGEKENEAEKKKEMKDHETMGAFETMFIISRNFLLKYDDYVQIFLPAAPKKFVHDWPYTKFIHNKISHLVRMALGDRVVVLDIFSKPLEQWAVGSLLPSVNNNHLILGLLLDPRTFTRNVDLFKYHNDPEKLAEWQSFWGSKSKLRRFKDGAITYSCVWDGVEKHRVIHSIIQHILTLHASITPAAFDCWGGKLDDLLHTKRLKDNTFSVVKAFDSLKETLQGIELPLQIEKLFQISPDFRSCSMVPCLGMNEEKNSYDFFTEFHSSPLMVYIQLTLSKAWPDEIELFEKVKSVFYFKIAESLEGKYRVSATYDFVELEYEGYLFRLVLYHTYETVLRQKVNDENGIRAMNILEWKIQHHNLIHEIVINHHSFGLSTRLAKRWVNAHLLGHHINEETIELMMAYIYSSRSYLSVPSTYVSGFLRFLDILANFDFSNQPLIVDPRGELTMDQMSEIEKTFLKFKNRTNMLGGGLFLVTSYDPSSESWTKYIPTKMILKRLKIFAQQSLDLLINEDLLFTPSTERWKAIFRTSLSEYDALIYLSRAHVIHFPHRIELFYDHGAKRYPRVNSKESYPFNPIEKYFECLRERFSSIAFFFYDRVGGDKIAILWKPRSFQESDLAPKNTFNAIPITRVEGRRYRVQINIEEVLEDMKLMASDLCVQIVKKQQENKEEEKEEKEEKEPEENNKAK